MQAGHEKSRRDHSSLVPAQRSASLVLVWGALVVDVCGSAAVLGMVDSQKLGIWH